VAITPWRNDDFWRMTRRADPAEYILTPPRKAQDQVA
jgi:4-hydroxyacetophenone monooxygenase